MRQALYALTRCVALGLLMVHLTWPSVSVAQKPAPQPVPAELATPDLAWRGTARFTYFGFDVYDATLWTTPTFQAQAAHEHVLALELHYLRNFEAKDIAQRSIQEMRRITTVSPAQEQAWMAQMLRVFPKVRKGDRLLGLQRPGEAAVFWHNGQPRGEIADPEFAKLFFGIWLSARTSDPAFRLRLLGANP
jgi:hypothetical protein